MATAKAQSLQNDLNLKLSCADTNSSACVQGAGALYAYTDDTGLPAVLIGTQRTDQNLIQSDYFGTSSFSTWQDLKATYYELQIGSYQPPTAGQIASGELQGAAATVFPFINQDEGPNPNNPFVPFQPGQSAPSLMAGQPAGVQQGYSAGQQIGQMLWMVGGEAVLNSASPTSTTQPALGQTLINQPLTLEYFQDIYGADNVTQGGGTTLQTAERVNANVISSQQGNAASNFGQLNQAEGRLQEALGIWPPNGGAYAPIYDATLEQGALLDRYGYPGGNYLSPLGNSFGGRALPSYYESTKPYFQYEVIQPITGVTQSSALPWFGQPGMDVQFQTPQTVQWYLDNGYLKEIKK